MYEIHQRLTDGFYEVEARAKSALAGFVYLDFSQGKDVRLDNVHVLDHTQSEDGENYQERGIATLLMAFAMLESQEQEHDTLIATFIPTPRDSEIAKIAALNFYNRLGIRYDETKLSDNLSGNVEEVLGRCNQILSTRRVPHVLKSGF